MFLLEDFLRHKHKNGNENTFENKYLNILKLANT